MVIYIIAHDCILGTLSYMFFYHPLPNLITMLLLSIVPIYLLYYILSFLRANTVSFYRLENSR